MCTDDLDGESFSPDGEMNTMMSGQIIESQPHATPSTLTSNRSNEPRMPASLNPSVDSTPSPYTSPDMGSNSLDGVRLNVRNDYVPVRPFIPSRESLPNTAQGNLIYPTVNEPLPATPPSPVVRNQNPIINRAAPSPLTMVRSPLVPGRSGAPLRAKSNLTALIHEKQSAVDNPFAEEYAFVSGKGEPNPMSMVVYLPFSSNPKEPMTVAVKRDAVVEDVIGYILYQYAEERRQPLLADEKCDVVKWVLRIAEDDGEIDEDIPPFDRMRKINKLSFDDFALCEATAAQQKTNEQAHQKLLKIRPPKREKPVAFTPTNTMTSTQSSISESTTPENQQPPLPVPTVKNTLTKSALTNPAYQYVKVRLMTEKDVSSTTLLSVYADMFLGDVLEMVCRKKKLDPNLYILKVADKDVVVPLDRTMESLHGVEEMALVKKSEAAPSSGNGSIIWRSTRHRKKDNSSDVLPALPVSASAASSTPNEFMGQYKKYIVNRKSNMLGGRHERVLAIDGDYIHLMPPEQKGIFERVKTSSYPINQVHSCKQSKKMPQNFKLTVVKDRESKAYELEAESARDAQEICDKILYLQQVNMGQPQTLK